jgi:hypothetical protein
MDRGVGLGFYSRIRTRPLRRPARNVDGELSKRGDRAEHELRRRNEVARDSSENRDIARVSSADSRKTRLCLRISVEAHLLAPHEGPALPRGRGREEVRGEHAPDVGFHEEERNNLTRR